MTIFDNDMGYLHVEHCTWSKNVHIKLLEFFCDGKNSMVSAYCDNYVVFHPFKLLKSVQI